MPSPPLLAEMCRVFHELLVELQLQLVVEVGEEGKEDGQEEGEEVESGEGRVKEKQPCGWPWRWVKGARLSSSHGCECDDQGL